ncbi:MAG: hypothetical protein LBV71_03535 [Prevotella sp.]|jgi:hypothetical protein|nr:hypothetical protein [Prevotella sp.]
MDKDTGSFKTEALAGVVFRLLKEHRLLADFEMKRDVDRYGYSNPVATSFPTVADAIAFFSQFDEPEGLDLHHSRFTQYANAIMFEITLKLI